MEQDIPRMRNACFEMMPSQILSAMQNSDQQIITNDDAISVQKLYLLANKYTKQKLENNPAEQKAGSHSLEKRMNR